MLFIVTDHAEKAVRGLLGLSLKAAPVWLAVVSSPEGLRQIPNGAPVMSLWFSDGSLVEALWREERVRKGRVFDLDYGRHADRIADWLARTAAREAALIAEYCAERGEAVPVLAQIHFPSVGGAIAAVKGEARLADAAGVEPPPSVPSSIPQKRAARWS
jgi:hypothetical protein